MCPFIGLRGNTRLLKDGSIRPRFVIYADDSALSQSRLYLFDNIVPCISQKSPFFVPSYALTDYLSPPRLPPQLPRCSLTSFQDPPADFYTRIRQVCRRMPECTKRTNFFFFEKSPNDQQNATLTYFLTFKILN